MDDIGGGLDGRLAEGTHLNGTLKFDRAVQIDGRFEGNVKSPGKLILGPTAQVDAETPVAVGQGVGDGLPDASVEARGVAEQDRWSRPAEMVDGDAHAVGGGHHGRPAGFGHGRDPIGGYGPRRWGNHW